MIRYQQGVDQNGLPIAGAIPQSDSISNMHFTAAGAKSQGIPAGANLVLIQRTNAVDLNVSIGGTAAAFAADNDFSSSGTSSGQEVNSVIRWLRGATSISVYASAPCDVTLSYYS